MLTTTSWTCGQSGPPYTNTPPYTHHHTCTHHHTRVHIRLDAPRRVNYYQPMLKKFRQARSQQPELQEAAWADEQKMGEHGKRFMTTANKVMVLYVYN